MEALIQFWQIGVLPGMTLNQTAITVMVWVFPLWGLIWILEGSLVQTIEKSNPAPKHQHCANHRSAKPAIPLMLLDLEFMLASRMPWTRKYIQRLQRKQMPRSCDDLASPNPYY